MKLLIIGLLACLLAAATGSVSNGRDMYFEESEESGDGTVITDSLLPPDDEDTDEESSGDTDETTEVIAIDGDEEDDDDDDDGDDDDGDDDDDDDDEVGGRKTKILEREPDKEIDVEGDHGMNAAETEGEDTGDAAAAAAGTQFLAAVIVGGCIGLLFAICVIMLLVYRMRKKDEGSYALEYGLDKKPQGNYEYTKGVDSKEYFA